MERTQPKDLLRKYVLGQCTEEEASWVEKWYEKQGPGSPFPIAQDDFENDIEEVYYQLIEKDTKASRIVYIKRAAAIFTGFFLIFGAWLYFQKETGLILSDLAPVVANDISPANHRVNLRLSTGSTLSLDDLEIGETRQIEDVIIRKAGENQIEYTAGLGLSLDRLAGNSFYNVLTVPEGRQYQLTLPDGSNVWLNAMSSLTFPIRFDVKKREVQLVGEAYFEINKQWVPFYVLHDQQQIEVLGTRFNVNAYSSEKQIKTTLLEGAVKVVSKHLNTTREEVFIGPNEQVTFVENKPLIVEPVNASQAIAWRDGLFSFQGTTLESVMNEFSRWYGVEVEFEGELPLTELWGEVYRNVNASQALKVLEYFDLKFKIIEDKGISKIEISAK